MIRCQNQVTVTVMLIWTGRLTKLITLYTCLYMHDIVATHMGKTSSMTWSARVAITKKSGGLLHSYGGIGCYWKGCPTNVILFFGIATMVRQVGIRSVEWPKCTENGRCPATLHSCSCTMGNNIMLRRRLKTNNNTRIANTSIYEASIRVYE
jgi:hypothetical protein